MTGMTSEAVGVVRALAALSKAIHYQYLPEEVEVTKSERHTLIWLVDHGLGFQEPGFVLPPGTVETCYGLKVTVTDDPRKPDLPETRALHEALALAAKP